jgi:hypothetical protein
MTEIRIGAAILTDIRSLESLSKHHVILLALLAILLASLGVLLVLGSNELSFLSLLFGFLLGILFNRLFDD